MSDQVALLRGINVGTAKRLAMADLRAVFISLGFADVATLLNSGNVVFDAPETPDAALVRRAVLEATGVESETVVLPGDRFRRIADANPLRRPDREPKRLSVAFAASALVPGAISVPIGIEPEEIMVTPHAVYQWLPNGVLASPVSPSFWRTLGTTVTARNDATVIKISELLAARA